MGAAMQVDLPIPIEAVTELETKLGLDLGGFNGYRAWDACPPKYVSPVPDVEGAWFDIAAVIKVVQVLRRLPHTRGRWGGTPFEPAPWELIWIIAPVFGWKHPDGRRVFRRAFIEVPRKNGKTSLVSRLLVYLLTADGEMGAEVYAAATADRQARRLFDEPRAIVGQAQDLQGRVQVLASVIRVPRTGGIFRVLSKLSDIAHGLNVHAAGVDEVHLHKNRGLIDAIRTGTGARWQPLIIYITTAGDADETTIYAELHNASIKIAERTERDPALYAVIWGADADDDPFSRETWEKASPNFPVSPSAEYLEDEARQAQISPAYLPTHLRLNLNVRQGLTTLAPITGEMWSRGVQSVTEDKLKGKACWGGLVSASWNELSGLNWTFRNPEGPGWWSLWRWFLPEASLPDLLDRTNNAAQVWVDDKRITLTEGDETDADRHLAQIRKDAARYDVKELAYDPNGTIGITSPLHSSGEITCVPIFSQSPGSAMVDWQRLLMAGEYQHGGDPIAAWQVANLRARSSIGGILKIDRVGSLDNVYGIAAAEMALRRALIAVEKRPGRIASGG